MAELVETAFNTEVVEPVLTIGGTSGHRSEHLVAMLGL